MSQKINTLLFLNINDDEAYIIHTLTTSKNNKLVLGKNFGCSVEHNVPYFFIPAGKELQGELGYLFKKDTFIFFQNNIRKEKTKCF